MELTRKCCGRITIDVGFVVVWFMLILHEISKIRREWKKRWRRKPYYTNSLASMNIGMEDFAIAVGRNGEVNVSDDDDDKRDALTWVNWIDDRRGRRRCW